MYSTCNSVVYVAFCAKEKYWMANKNLALHWSVYRFSKLICLLALIFSPVSHATELTIAVSSNFYNPLKRIALKFKEENPSVRPRLSTGSSGSIYTKIKNGAPYDLFLSADQELPERLQKEGLVVPESLHNYAVGRLVVWGPRLDFFERDEDIFTEDGVNVIVLPNPKVAPYGQSAKAFLEREGVWKKIEKKVVYAENVGQAFQYIETGHVQIGFVALSQLRTMGISPEKSAWILDSDDYPPIRQYAVVLNRGQNKEVAQKFLDYLMSEKIQNMIARMGYGAVLKPEVVEEERGFSFGDDGSEFDF